MLRRSPVAGCYSSPTRFWSTSHLAKPSFWASRPPISSRSGGRGTGTDSPRSSLPRMVATRASSSLAIASSGESASPEMPSSGYMARRNHCPSGPSTDSTTSTYGMARYSSGVTPQPSHSSLHYSDHSRTGSRTDQKLGRLNGIASAQPDNGRQRSIAACVGWHCPARRHRPYLYRRTPVRDLLAATALQGVRRLRNVALLAADGYGHRQSRLGRPADLHLAPLLPHGRLDPHRQRHRQARRPQ